MGTMAGKVGFAASTYRLFRWLQSGQASPHPSMIGPLSQEELMSELKYFRLDVFTDLPFAGKSFVSRQADYLLAAETFK